MMETGFDKITIDGVEMIFAPLSAEVTHASDFTTHRTLDRTSIVFADYNVGHPRMADRYSFAVPYGNIDDNTENGDTKDALERIRKSGPTHTLCLWQEEYEFFIAAAAQERFYLPMGRGDAFELDATAPFVAVVNPDTAPAVLTVVRKTTAEVLAGGVTAGQLWIGDDHDATGHVPLAVPALTAEDVLRIRYIPVFRVGTDSANREFRTVVEGLALAFTETGR